jgi:hypothetical protein
MNGGGCKFAYSGGIKNTTESGKLSLQTKFEMFVFDDS